MAYIWETRSVVPGDHRFTAAAVANFAVGGGAEVYPSTSNVWYGTTAYGPTGADYTPGKRASSIANCTAGNVRSGVVIDNVTGTYDPTSYGPASDAIATVMGMTAAKIFQPGAVAAEVN